MTLTREEKLQIMRNINWDYTTPPQDMLDIIEGTVPPGKKEGAFSRKTLFVRCLERLRWHTIVELWGIDQMLELYTPELKHMIRRELREKHDVIFKVLRGEPVPATGWSAEYYKSERYRFFSDRGNGSK